MSSSGLIYAVIVGAWAAYLVPMWLRRQDELNEGRPTERFTTAIRLLSGRAALERRYARALAGRDDDHGVDTLGDFRTPAPGPGTADADAADSGTAARATAAVDQPADSDDPADTADAVEHAAHAEAASPLRGSAAGPRRAVPGHPAGTPGRAALLARRRRVVSVLFLLFTIGALAAAFGGLALLWAPLVPGLLLSLYIGYLRRQERRRYLVQLDHRRAAEAARRLHAEGRARRAEAARAAERDDPAAAPATPLPPVVEPTSRSRAMVEETDHAEWVDSVRGAAPDRDSWEPVAVPLPTYVTAPVAPRNTGPLDLDAPDTWSSARTTPAQPGRTQPGRTQPGRTQPGRTPLYDQYADPSAAPYTEDRPRAANE
ncbi:divisome protein SepX/GlpR [Allostreptomyces psammosilenae]|uniref:Uncharacterized protein n=1 Tax=Allostreptomyces psammosilenae TaxID=1892865 RepID=A0A853A4H8_9ACTN|nr:gephyrin-like molybdotransferase receptor GlpR [Allostreptomyces psammosilenae]NYI07784.1 hypothetical protein [Allostreptomyces psammosilenae]